ncbi:MAG: histidine kinase [Leadbetterella sp.]|nr:histidine kinase [Leadbetterella sp.]
MSPAVAQEMRFGNNILFDMMMTEKDRMITEPVYVPVSDTAVYRIFDRMKKDGRKSFTPKSPVMLGIKLNPSLVYYYGGLVPSVSKYYQTFTISDSSAAEVMALGVNPENVDDFHYRVVENDSLEVVPWSPIPRLEQRYGAKHPFGFLGSFKAPGRRVMVEVASKENYGVREGVIFDWRKSFKPVLSQIIISTPHDYFDLRSSLFNKNYAGRFDHDGMPLDFRFPADSVLSITLQFKKPETLVHTVYLISQQNSKADTSHLGFVDQYGFFRLNRSYFSQPGRYELIIKKQEKVPDWNSPHMLRLAFDVLPSGETAIWRKVLPYSGVLILLFAVYLGYSRRRLRTEQRQKRTAQLRLKSLRAQLNPHFMFNALSSVQNLMNKNELLEANRYLSKFAGLTRAVLNTTEREMISLQEELAITEDYLQMEQLRFGFRYVQDVTDALSPGNTDVPAMLLQPFIENAVKHGVGGMRDRGLIRVNVRTEKNNLLLSVTDNGPGFDTATTRKEGSFGLKLSEERITALNEVYKNIALNISSVPGHTEVKITFYHWISYE